MDSVVAYADKSIAVFPNNALPYFYKGIALVQAKKPELAIQPLNHALDLESENQALIAQLYATLGDVYNTQQNYSYSDSCFEKALKIQPDDASTLNNYAYYLSVRKIKLSDAERMSKKSLELMPNSKSFLDTYGWILYQQGNFTEAKIYIEKAIAAAGDDDGTLLEHLGDVYFKLNETEKAIEYWEKAKSKGEDNPLLLKKISEGKLYE
jgi:Tfp pilus assembly protein PilF